jgi:hypothetical protein
VAACEVAKGAPAALLGRVETPDEETATKKRPSTNFRSVRRCRAGFSHSAGAIVRLNTAREVSCTPHKIALARRTFGGTVQAFCMRRRTMACAITSLFLMAMFGIILAGLAFLPSANEKPSARRQETPTAPSGDHVIA